MQLSITDKILGFHNSKDLGIVESTLNKLVSVPGPGGPGSARPLPSFLLFGWGQILSEGRNRVKAISWCSISMTNFPINWS